MKYDFTTMLDRRGKDALAVDLIGCQAAFAAVPSAPKEGFDAIPMWVADMSFPTAPPITEHILKRAGHPAFGYFVPSDAYYASIVRWQKTRNDAADLETRHIGYENGVLGCVSSAIQAFTSPGDGILLHSPTYIGFTHVLHDIGRRAVLSPLRQDENGTWRMDLEDIERRLREERIHFAILCSPHNPCGRVWERWELEDIMEIFRRNQVIVLSDEIWSDILLDGHRHIPTQSVSGDARARTIAVYAPSKTFNLAGLIGSYHIVYDDWLRDRLRRQSALSHYNAMNVLSMHALIGAYSEEGQAWTDELCRVLSANIGYAYDHMKELRGVRAAKPEGTYMMLLQCEEYCRASGRSIGEVIRAGWDAGVAFQEGEPFHVPCGIRMNFALPFRKAAEAVERLEKYVFL